MLFISNLLYYSKLNNFDVALQSQIYAEGRKDKQEKIEPKMKENAIEMYSWMTRTRALIKYRRAAKIYLINTLEFG